MGNLLKRFWRTRPDAAQHHPVKAEVLVVEDNPDEMEFISGLLRLQSAIVTGARSIAGALEAIGGERQFQLAFVDLSLPNGSGVEVIRRIKNCQRETHVVVVSSSLEKLPQVLDFGYVGILWKPYSLHSIRTVLHMHRLPVND